MQSSPWNGSSKEPGELYIFPVSEQMVYGNRVTAYKTGAVVMPVTGVENLPEFPLFEWPADPITLLLRDSVTLLLCYSVPLINPSSIL